MNAVTICDRKAREKDITVDLFCAEDMEAIGNPALLEQAVANLLDNAIKYSDPHSRVLIEAAAGEGEMTVKVSDDGIGIPEKELPRIFERFYRVDKARSREMGGTGLGLAIVKHIVQTHNGSVTVISAMGKGSAFTIHLPTIRRN
jgi:two-component system phosphate regulon sensor histidine kinase PhoR